MVWAGANPQEASLVTDNAVLEARDLTRRFGGLIAVDHVSLALRVGELHALIGTNGAGKSTVINLLSGELPCSNGSMLLDGHEISNWPQARRARAGIGRSYQRTTIFPEFTVLENCRLCAQAARPGAWRFFETARDCKASLERAHAALAATGLADGAQRLAGSMSHGEKRQLEIAMCLATEPRVLLLDEPLAGMGQEESERLLSLLENLKPGHAILLVEHDMDAVFRVADVITVMVNGAVIASDTPGAIRVNAQVQHAYLGEGVHD